MNNYTDGSFTSNSSCPKSIDNFTSLAQFGPLMTPTRDSVYWNEKTTAYYAFFYIMLTIFGVLFLALGVFCVLLLIKRHLTQRFPEARTFIPIVVALMILGFSRVFFLIVDPWGQSGFCQGHIVCRVLSRLSGALTFPSLTASYSIVFITIWTSTKIQLGQPSTQCRVLIPLSFIHYFVAIIFEIIGLIPWPDKGSASVVISLLIGCEIIFSLWGFMVCFSYLFSGCSLYRSIQSLNNQSSTDSPAVTAHETTESSDEVQNNVRYVRVLKKITIVMYLTVTLGMLYSVLSGLVNIILILLIVFDGCPGFITGMETQHPGVWLFLRYLFFTLEYLLALLIMYSIVNFRPIFALLCCKIGNIGSELKHSTQDYITTGLDKEEKHSNSYQENGTRM